MKKFITTLCALALTVTVANAQTTKGTMTFGIGTNFTNTTDAEGGQDANVGYFVMDGIMVSASFHMDMADEGDTNWGFGARYYYGDDGMWGGLSAANGMDEEGEDTVDMMVQVGYSKALGMDGKLWFEPTLNYDMAGDGSLGLGAAFRLAS